MESLSTTNVWLGILAVVSFLELLIVAGMALFGFRLYKKATMTLETMEREHVAPLRSRIDGVLDDVQRVVDGAKHAQESVTDVLRHVTGTGTAVAGVVRSKTWPIIGLLQGLKTAAAVVMRNGRKSSHDSAYGPL